MLVVVVVVVVPVDGFSLDTKGDPKENEGPPVVVVVALPIVKPAVEEGETNENPPVGAVVVVAIAVLVVAPPNVNPVDEEGEMNENPPVGVVVVIVVVGKVAVDDPKTDPLPN